jgi:diguanylate cyclase (GGDEF)-like protein/PAS domain S-box-containing protein
MDSPFERRQIALAALAVPTVLAAMSILLSAVGWDTAASWPGRLAVVGATAVATAALTRRGLAEARPGGWRGGLPWWLLAAAALAYGLWLLLDPVAGAGGASIGHLLLASSVVAALWLLPSPRMDRRSTLRVTLDVAVAGLACSVPVCQALFGDEHGPAPAGLDAVVHPIVDVLLATAAVGALARARRGGGLAIPSLGALATGAVLLSVTDVLLHRGSDRHVAVALLSVSVLCWAVGAALPDRPESDASASWRERVAVLVPLAPLALAAAVLLGSAVFDQRLAVPTLVCAVLLSAALVAGGVLDRLDHLATERRLDDLVLRRTVSLGAREKWFRTLVQNASDVITVVDLRGTVRYVTPSITRVLGHEPHTLVGSRVTSLLRPADGRRLEAALVAAARDGDRPVTLELPVWSKDGTWCDTETTVTSLVHDPDVRGLVLTTRDVSEHRRLKAALNQQAFSDVLTGLANRSLFRARVEAALTASLGRGQVAVLVLDLDGFKSVNDSQGHHVGDELLGIVARRLTGSVRPGDLVARLGGDEFAILVAGEEAEKSATWVAHRVRRALAAPFVLDGRELSVGASTGVAVSDTGEETADQLLRNADLAMHRAKHERDLSFVRFEAQMHDALLKRVQAETDLRHAVAHGDLVLHYQPVVELGGGRVVGVEALVRWNHAELGLVAPAEFIDLAEETGLVSDIGRWALQESCRQGARWQRHAALGGHFKIAVNVSARQLEPGLGRQVRDALANSGLPGSALTLEMTESVLMARTDEVVSLLRRLRTLGVRVAVDDFGTGYSSLSYLSRFPVDILKIDKSFVQDLGQGGGQGELVRTIVRLGESLRLDTVAEGIETQEQRSALEAMGCTFGQGYLFARPLPAEEIDRLLDAQTLAVHDAEDRGEEPVSLGR